MKTTIFSLSAVLLLVICTFFFFPGCNKSGEMAAISKEATAKVKSAKTDTPVTPPLQYISVPLSGDQITLVPHYYKSPTADSSYIYFTAQPKNSYCYNSTLEFSSNLDVNGNYTISFLDVKEPATCIGGDSPLFAEINFTSDPAGKLPNGTFPLSVTLNGTTYTGSITSTTTAITFNWNYTTGVLITPTQLSR